MPKKPDKEAKELATVPIKLNVTPTEFALLERACEIQHARRVGPWMRDAALEVARKVVNEAEPAPHGKRKA